MHAIDWLGEVVVRRGGRPLPLPIRKAQALLVLLAREGSMARDRIVALLWPTLDESSGRRNLRRELVRLRDAGAGALVVAEGDRLAVAPGVEVTARVFEHALRAERPDDALALWRGTPADGLQLDDGGPWDEWLLQERRRLEALHAQALASAAALHEAAGALPLALERLRSLLAADPLQERHHVAVMRLLVRQGQREAALTQYDSCVRLLADELGLAPMAETRALADALRGSGTVAAPAATSQPARPSTLPAPVAGNALALLPERLPFVGREREVAWLERAWCSGQALLVEGEGGVGKTRLVSDFASSHGPYAIVRCRLGDTDAPLSSFARSLRALAGAEPDLQEWPGWVREELPRLMPELGRAPLPLRSEDERVRFGQACAWAWRHWSAGNFDAVVVDDWHLADPHSQALWMQVHEAAEAEPAPRLILVYRPALVPAAAERLLTLVQGGAQQLRLEPLPPQAVFELVQRLSGHAEPRRFAAMLARATDGNPFYIAETLRHLLEQGLLLAAPDGSWHTPIDASTQGYEELPLPDSVRAAVLGRVARLPERARRVLEAAALADEPLEAALLAPACALSEVETTLALEDALQARLLREADEGGLGFMHPLVQQALDSGLDAARRRSVHRRLALGAAAAGAPPARIAAHHEAGGEPRRAVPWRRRAGDEAMRLHARDEAVVQWRLALADGATQDDALAIRVALLRALDDLDRADEAGEAAADILRPGAHGDASEALRIEARIAAAYFHAHRNAALRSLEVLDALPAALEGRLRALALDARSTAMKLLDRPDDAVALAEQALAIDGLNDEERSRALQSLLDARWYLGQFHEVLRLVEQVRGLASARGDQVRLARALGQEGNVLAELGEWDAAEAKLREAAALAARFGLVARQRNTLVNLCVLHSMQGRPDAVLQAAHSCWELKPPMPLDSQRVLIRMAFVESHGALGDLGAAYTWARGGIADAQALGRGFGAAAVCTSCAELLAVLGEGGQLAPLLAMLESPAAKSVRVADETWLMMAESALMSGQLQAALAARQRAAGVEQDQSVRMRVRAQFVDAALLQAGGDAEAALERLPDDLTPGLNDELRQRVLAVRLRAEADSGGCAAATLAAADAALRRPGVHAVAALLLHRALLQVAETTPLRLAWQERVRAMALTLHGLPELRDRFERHWLGVQ